ncbi:hypothetical protein CFK39_13570 [Brachybacterium avium]|uniref:Uncharacterized protein n=1 Tax=Brachybacterium avium TaxID=2017485 RepID=A0A220UEV0_9MICO|nr:hypothetical protein [Brachybacterium avium]ASK66669.1 hypothetical protein CFK39_13570 [Brachybacterium avium]
MSTPAPSPRHLPPSGPSTPPGLFGGRQAAKLRAIVNADLLPEERASADALVMTTWLTATQRAQYAPSLRSGPSTEEFAQRLADERRVVLEEGADPVADELESAAQAEQRARQLPLRLVEAVLLLVAFTAVVIMVVLSIRSESAGLAERVPEQGLTLLVVALVAGLLAALVGTVATRRRDHLLLGWAASRPGQLGRGLPLQRPLQGESAGPAIARALGPALLVAAGVLMIVAGAALLLISPMLGDVGGVSHWSPWLLGGGAAALVAAVLIIYLRSRRLRQIVRRYRAAEWIGPAPQVEEPPAV